MFSRWENELAGAGPWTPLAYQLGRRPHMARPRLSPALLRRRQITLSLRDDELAELKRRAELARLSVAEYIRQRTTRDRLARRPAVRVLGTAEFREVNRLGVNVNQIARALNAGRPIPADAAKTFYRLRSLLSQLLPE